MKRCNCYTHNMMRRINRNMTIMAKEFGLPNSAWLIKQIKQNNRLCELSGQD